MKLIMVILQFIITALFLIGEIISQSFDLRVPGSIIGIFLLFFLYFTQRRSRDRQEPGRHGVAHRVALCLTR